MVARARLDGGKGDGAGGMKSKLLSNPWIHVAMAVGLLVWILVIWVALKLIGRLG
jgi:hypothetical protein